MADRHEEILNFIKRRFSADANWNTGNCYWFAFILTTRFSRLRIYYLPITNRFVAGDGENFYDWSGRHLREWYDEVPHEWESYDLVDSIEYKRIIRDCVN